MENSGASTEKRISDIEKTLEHMRGLILACAESFDNEYCNLRLSRKINEHLKQQKISPLTPGDFPNQKFSNYLSCNMR